MADCSNGGARLTIDGPVRLPPRFTLHFDGLETGIACELRHNDGGTVGVEFATKGGAMPREQAQAIEQLLTWLGR
jgi:hypothetical protein